MRSIQFFNHVVQGAVSNGIRVSDKKRDKKSRKSDSSGSSEASVSGNSGNKFSTTWRPVGDYIHLKIQFCVQDTTLQVWYYERNTEFSSDPLDHWTELSSVGHWELCRVLQDCWPDRCKGGRGGGGRGGHGRWPEDGRNYPIYQVIYQVIFWICRWKTEGTWKINWILKWLKSSMKYLMGRGRKCVSFGV